MSDENQEIKYGLIMPFVVCQSKGGPFEDQAFVAGYQAGQIDRALEMLAVDPLADKVHYTTTVMTALIPQLDLIAMNRGFKMISDETGQDGWTYATFWRLE